MSSKIRKCYRENYKNDKCQDRAAECVREKWKYETEGDGMRNIVYKSKMNAYKKERWYDTRAFSYKSYVFMKMAAETCFLTIRSSLLLKMMCSKYHCKYVASPKLR